MESDDKKDLDPTEPILEPIPKTVLPTIAGSILIVSAIITILVSVTLILINESTINAIIQTTPQIQDLMSEFNLTAQHLMGLYSNCGIIGIVMSIFIILSAILSFKRKLWGIAIVGTLVGIATFILTIFSGIIAVIPLILLIVSRKEFT